MRILSVMMVTGLLLSAGTAKALFSDDFNRADSVDVANGWSEMGSTASIDPQIVGNEVSWINLASSDGTKNSYILKTFDAAKDVRVDLKWSTSGASYNRTSTSMGLFVGDINDQDYLYISIAGESTTSSNWLTVKVSYYKNGVQTDSWTGIGGHALYHNYRVTMNDRSKTRLYIDNQEKWVSSDSGLTSCTKSYILASRWWRWHQFFADNFMTAAEPTSFVDGFTALDTGRWSVITSSEALGVSKQPNGQYINFFTNSAPYSRPVSITANGQLALPINAGDTNEAENNYSNVVLTRAPENWKTITVKIKGSVAFDDPLGWNQFNIVLWKDHNNLVKFGFNHYDSTATDNPLAGHMIIGGGIETNSSRHTTFGGINDAISNAMDLVLRIEKKMDGTYKYSISTDNGATMTLVADNVVFADADGANVQIPNFIGVYAAAGRWTGTYGSDWSTYDPTSNRNVDVLVDEFAVSDVAPAMAGDANNDGMVDVGDLGILAANYGGSGKNWAEGDFNDDGLVDVGDLGILAAHYGEGVPNAALDFNADYAKVFGTTVADDSDATEEISSSICSGLGLPIIAGLVLMGLMLTKLEE